MVVQADIITLKVDEVVFREDLYPRIETSAARVQAYVDCLEYLPPIEVNQHNELIDGWHRWTAYRTVEREEIPVVVTQTRSEAEFLELAIERNAAHGFQLSREDKRRMAIRIYLGTSVNERSAKKQALANQLKVSHQTVHSWLQDIDSQAKKERDERILNLWLACYTDKQIADDVGLEERSIGRITDKFQEPEFCQKPFYCHQEESYSPPLYNVWSFNKNSADVTHAGNSEQVIVDNLLYMYTNPLDIVVDPFAGSGTTADVCKKRLRRYWVSDRRVLPAFENKIRLHDITDGLPDLKGRWKDIKLVYLDPPYWKQAEGFYGDDPTNLANMDLAEFNKTLSGIINAFAKQLSPGAHIALLIQPTQWNALDRQIVDHVMDMVELVKAPVERRISCPYTTQQYNAQMVKWAKEHKECLVLTRELVVWQM